MSFGILQELRASPHRNQQNLEDAGLLVVDYEGLDAFARDEAVWAGIPGLARRDPAERADYLRGFLDVLRKRMAIAHPALTHPLGFQRTVVDALDERCLFHSESYADGIVGYSDTADDSRRGVTVRRFSRSRSLVHWTVQVLEVDRPTAAEQVIPAVVRALQHEEAAYLVEHLIERVGALSMVNPDLLAFRLADGAPPGVSQMRTGPPLRRRSPLHRAPVRAALVDRVRRELLPSRVPGHWRRSWASRPRSTVARWPARNGESWKITSGSPAPI